ncbi:MAG: TonB family protein [Planctomycetes bacterium]|nr:TonB family protein [Planctomycetota bacterium]
MKRESLRALLAAAVNVCLFLGIAGANPSSRLPPAREAWSVHELFHTAATPRAVGPRTDCAPSATAGGPRAAARPAVVLAAPSAPAVAAVRFEPRIGPASRIDAGMQALAGGPALRVEFASPGGTTAGQPVGLPGAAAIGATGGRGGDGARGDGIGAGPGGGGTGVFGLSEVDRPPGRVVAPVPPYPSWGRVQRLEGVVTLRIVVGEDGRVREAGVERVEGDARFGEIARAGVRDWRFEPAVAAGRKVACVVTQRIRFQLVD